MLLDYVFEIRVKTRLVHWFYKKIIHKENVTEKIKPLLKAVRETPFKILHKSLESDTGKKFMEQMIGTSF